MIFISKCAKGHTGNEHLSRYIIRLNIEWMNLLHLLLIMLIESLIFTICSNFSKSVNDY